MRKEELKDKILSMLTETEWEDLAAGTVSVPVREGNREVLLRLKRKARKTDCSPAGRTAQPFPHRLKYRSDKRCRETGSFFGDTSLESSSCLQEYTIISVQDESHLVYISKKE